MQDHHRLRGIFLYASALYLATSFMQLHAKQPNWRGVGSVSLSGIASSLRWHMLEMARTEQDENQIFLGN